MYRWSVTTCFAGLTLGAVCLAGLMLGSAEQLGDVIFGNLIPGLAICAIGLVVLGIGFAIFSNQKRIEIDDLLSGQSLIAYVDYEMDEKGEDNPGYAFIGPGGVFKNGFYFDWSDKSRNLLNVTLKHGPNPVLCFLYVVASSRTTSGGGMMQNCCMVPIPAGQEALAREVLARFKA